MLLLLVLVGVALVGSVAAHFGISPRTMDRVGVAARVIASVTAAGLLSLAFVVDKLSSPSVDVAEFFRGDIAVVGSVVLLVTVGAAGLLAALALAVFEPPDSDCVSRSARCCRCLHRWAGGCLATASVAVVLLFPAVIALIFTAGDVARGI